MVYFNTYSAFEQTTSLNHGNVIYLKQYGTYLGMCGWRPDCGGEHWQKYGVIGHPGKPSRTKWQVEKAGMNYYLKQPDHNAYLGMCGTKTGCDGSQHGMMGFSGKPARTMCQVEQSGGYFYFKHPLHGTYLGMCGTYDHCWGSKYNVIGFSGRQERTRWIIKKMEGEGHKDEGQEDGEGNEMNSSNLYAVADAPLLRSGETGGACRNAFSNATYNRQCNDSKTVLGCRTVVWNH